MNKKKMIEDAMLRIMQVREMQAAYLTCTTALNRKNPNYKQGDGKVFADLVQWELDEWSGLLMWGLVADQGTQDRVKAAAHERFLSDKFNVSKWFTGDENPAGYLTADDEEFRAMAKKAFAPTGKTK
jgi:hypothetical protein